jgi:nucleotide-binding universal stress UspA family protein
MFDPVVVPLDGSRLSEAVLPYAQRISRSFRAHVRLVHVLDPDELLGDLVLDDPKQKALFDEFVEEERRQAVLYLKRQQADSLRGIESSVTVLRAPRGATAQVIAEHAEEQDAGLIAMTTHGRAGLDRWAMGSVADRVAHTSRTPLLLFRPKDEQEAEQERLSTVMLPLDGSDLAEASLQFGVAIAKAMGLRVVLVRVASQVFTMYRDETAEHVRQAEGWLRQSAHDYLKAIQSQFTAEGLEASLEIEAGHPAQAIIEQAISRPGTLIVMTSHGRSGIGRWLLGSVADKVIRSGAAPVLLLRSGV